MRYRGFFAVCLVFLPHIASAQWIKNGVPLCTASGDQIVPFMTSDGAGGAIVAWSDTRNGNVDAFAQRISNAGTVLWAAGGVPVCTAAGDQSEPNLIPDGSHGAFLVWYDQSQRQLRHLRPASRFQRRSAMDIERRAARYTLGGPDSELPRTHRVGRSGRCHCCVVRHCNSHASHPRAENQRSGRAAMGRQRHRGEPVGSRCASAIQSYSRTARAVPSLCGTIRVTAYSTSTRSD